MEEFMETDVTNRRAFLKRSASFGLLAGGVSVQMFPLLNGTAYADTTLQAKGLRSHASWSAWESLGGVIFSGPAVASWASGRLDCFAKGTDNALWHKWYDGSWHNWESLGGTIDDNPAA